MQMTFEHSPLVLMHLDADSSCQSLRNTKNFLKLNIQKCEIVLFRRSTQQGNNPECEIDESLLQKGSF